MRKNGPQNARGTALPGFITKSAISGVARSEQRGAFKSAPGGTAMPEAHLNSAYSPQRKAFAKCDENRGQFSSRVGLIFYDTGSKLSCFSYVCTIPFITVKVMMEHTIFLLHPGGFSTIDRWSVSLDHKKLKTV